MKKYLFMGILCSFVNFAFCQPKNINIEFWGRPIGELSSFVGHTFIIAKYELGGNKVEEAYGFYDFNTKDNSDLGGWVSNEFAKFDKNELFKVSKLFLKKTISKDELKSIYSIIYEFDKSKYHLTQNNCVKFVHEVAKTINLKTPKESDWTFPMKYLEKLKELN